MPEADPPLAENRPFRSGSRLSVGQARRGGPRINPFGNEDASQLAARHLHYPYGY